MRNLDEDARAVAGGGIGADRAAVVQVDQRLNSITHDLVILASLQIHNKTDTAGVVFKSRVIQTLGLGTKTIHLGYLGNGGLGHFWGLTHSGHV